MPAPVPPHGRAPAPGRPECALPRDGIDSWATAAIDELTQLPHVVRVGVAVVEGGGRRLLFTASDRPTSGPSGRSHEWCHLDAFAIAPLNDALASGDLVAGALRDLDPRYADFVEAQRDTPHVAVAVVPLAAEAPAVGGVVVYYSRSQAVDASHLDDLRSIALRLEDELRTTLRPTEPPPTALHRPLPGTRVAEHAMRADPAAIGGARRFLRSVLDDWSVPSEVSDHAVLCLSELATNALIHTSGGCHVRVELHDGVLTTHVHDNGAPAQPRVQPASNVLGGSGHGLRLVEALVDNWGRSTDSHSATVWFALSVSD